MPVRYLYAGNTYILYKYALLEKKYKFSYHLRACLKKCIRTTLCVRTQPCFISSNLSHSAIKGQVVFKFQKYPVECLRKRLHIPWCSPVASVSQKKARHSGGGGDECGGGIILYYRTIPSTPQPLYTDTRSRLPSGSGTTRVYSLY